MSIKKYYKEHDASELEPFYSQHVMAMTKEGLHSKSEIASQLAFRDKRIAELEAMVARPLAMRIKE